MCVYIYIYICISLADLHPNEPEDEAICADCVCVSAVFSLCVDKCDQAYAYV